VNTVSARGGFGWVLLSAMVFKRRQKQTWGDFLRGIFFPRRGWRRAFEYVGHRIKRLPDTPHKIALGFACGVFVSFSPLFGFHFLYAGLCALIVRGNILAAFLGTFVGNPLTFPLIAAVSYRFGLRILGYDAEADVDRVSELKDAMLSGISGLWHSVKSLVGLGDARWKEVGVFFSDVFWPYTIGGIIPGLIAATIFYFLSRPLIRTYQVRRRAKFKRLGGKAEPAE